MTYAIMCRIHSRPMPGCLVCMTWRKNWLDSFKEWQESVQIPAHAHPVVALNRIKEWVRDLRFG